MSERFKDLCLTILALALVVLFMGLAQRAADSDDYQEVPCYDEKNNVMTGLTCEDRDDDYWRAFAGLSFLMFFFMLAVTVWSWNS